MAKDKPTELVTHSLVRARFCECVAQLAGIAGHNLAFLMGLFSLLDALIDRPLEEALKHVKLAPAITAALLGTAESSPFTHVYKLVRHYEAGDWEMVDSVAVDLKINPTSIGELYVDSTTWAAQVLNNAPEETIH
jgi:EAL and modified HD-GYP domain-containing signal transduction protein